MRVTAMVHNLKLGFKSGGSRSRQDLDEVGMMMILTRARWTRPPPPAPPPRSLTPGVLGTRPRTRTQHRRRKLKKVEDCY